MELSFGTHCRGYGHGIDLGVVLRLTLGLIRCTWHMPSSSPSNAYMHTCTHTRVHAPHRQHQISVQCIHAYMHPTGSIRSRSNACMHTCTPQAASDLGRRQLRHARGQCHVLRGDGTTARPRVQCDGRRTASAGGTRHAPPQPLRRNQPGSTLCKARA